MAIDEKVSGNERPLGRTIPPSPPLLLPLELPLPLPLELPLLLPPELPPLLLDAPPSAPPLEPPASPPALFFDAEVPHALPTMPPNASTSPTNARRSIR